MAEAKFRHKETASSGSGLGATPPSNSTFNASSSRPSISSSSKIVYIQLDTPIQPNNSNNRNLRFGLFLIGTLLASHPFIWIILLHYGYGKNDVYNHNDDVNSATTTTTTTATFIGSEITSYSSLLRVETLLLIASDILQQVKEIASMLLKGSLQHFSIFILDILPRIVNCLLTLLFAIFFIMTGILNIINNPRRNNNNNNSKNNVNKFKQQ